MKVIAPIAVIVAWLPVAAAPAAAAPAAADVVREIVIKGNGKTTDDTIKTIAHIHEGDPFTPKTVRKVEIELVSCDLFKLVEVAHEPVPGGYRLNIKVKEKHSWVIAPAFYDQPNNRGGGIGFGENNLFGLNKKLLLYAQLATGDSFFIGALIDPAIRGTKYRYQADIYLLSRRDIEYRPPLAYYDQPREARLFRHQYLNGGLRGGLEVFEDATVDVRVRGAWIGYEDIQLGEGATLADVTDDPTATEVPPPGPEGVDISTELLLEYDNRINWFGLRHGDRYKLTLEHSTPLVSDFSYWYAGFRTEWARRLLDRHNVVVRSRGGFGHNLPYQQEFVNGGVELRGFKTGQFRGNLLLVGNVEYTFPVVTVMGVALRGLTFFDTSYVGYVGNYADPDSGRNYLPGHERLGSAPFKNTVGVGTRIFVRQVVLPLLGLDFGYGIERESWEVYLAIGLTEQ